MTDLNSWMKSFFADGVNALEYRWENVLHLTSAGARKIVMGGQTFTWGADPAPSLSLPSLPLSLFLPFPPLPSLPSPLVPSPPP